MLVYYFIMFYSLLRSIAFRVEDGAHSRHSKYVAAGLCLRAFARLACTYVRVQVCMCVNIRALLHPLSDHDYDEKSNIRCLPLRIGKVH